MVAVEEAAEVLVLEVKDLSQEVTVVVEEEIEEEEEEEVEGEVHQVEEEVELALA